MLPTTGQVFMTSSGNTILITDVADEAGHTLIEYVETDKSTGEQFDGCVLQEYWEQLSVTAGLRLG